MLTPHVLVLDNDPQIRACLENIGWQVHGVSTIEQADEFLRCYPVQLVILGLAGNKTLTLARALRERSEVGIILITNSDDQARRHAGFECGVDECLSRPIDHRELALRAKNLLRRVRHAQAFTPAPEATDTHLKRFAQWTLDTQRRRLIDRNDNETLLSHGEFQLLSTFLRNGGQTLSRDQLMDQIRNREWLPSDRSIDVLVGRLRRKLQDDPAAPELIITIHGMGYLFTASATPVALIARRLPLREAS